MKIGNVTIPGPLILAPMAGVTDVGFRAVCREQGADLTYTEMVSAKALCYQDRKSAVLLELDEGEHPAAVQLFGSDPACIEQAAGKALELSGADFLDLNMGCPVPKVANSGDGSGLMRTPELAVPVLEAAIRGAGGKPVTVKMRLGWDKGSINCLEFAAMLEQAGAAAFTLHGRTRSQMYSGHADWDYIRRLKEQSSVPVIANGDVFCGHDAVRILRVTGADAVMLGRGVFGNPWLFAQCRAALNGDAEPPLPPLAERCDTAMRQFELAAAHKGEKVACLEARRHYAWYLKGVPHASYWKTQVCRVETLDDLRKATEGIKRDLC